MKQRLCFPLNNKGFLFVKSSLTVSYMFLCVVFHPLCLLHAQLREKGSDVMALK